MSKNLNLHQKLVEIRKEAQYLQKDTEGYGYNYVSGSRVLETLRPKMDELGVIIYPEIQETTTKKVVTQTNKGEREVWVVEGKMNYILQNADEPNEKIKVPFHLNGLQDSPDKALGTALTYSERYFLLKFFNIATDKDDPDARKDKIKARKVKPKQKRIKKLLTYLKKNEIDNFDVTKRLKNSISKNLGVEKISECQDIEKLDNYISKLENKKEV